MVLFALYHSKYPSPHTKQPLSWRSIRSYISLCKGFLGMRYGFQLLGDTPRLKILIKSIASKHVTNTRKKRRGFRRRHLRNLWHACPAIQADTQAAVNQFAALSTAWHVLARAGELANATRNDLEFVYPTKGSPYAILWLRPLKKRGVEIADKVPQYIKSFDGGPTDTFHALCRLVEFHPVGKAYRATTPLFSLPAGGFGSKRATFGSGRPRLEPLTTRRFRGLVKGAAHVLGYPVGEFGAHSPRIGGATDIVSAANVSQENGQLLLKAKGRWGSDIGAIYARMTRRAQLSASALMQTAHGRDLEELLPTFTQPA